MEANHGIFARPQAAGRTMLSCCQAEPGIVAVQRNRKTPWREGRSCDLFEHCERSGRPFLPNPKGAAYLAGECVVKV